MNTLFRQTINRLLLAASSLLLIQSAHAESVDDIKAALLELIGPRVAASQVSPSPMEGVYQIELDDRVMYVSKAGDHVMIGEVYDTKRKVSLSEEIKQKKALEVLEDMDESEMIVFAPEETKRTITVYTDVDCPYCRKLHQEVPKLLARGVKVRYLWYPRSGEGTPSFDKAISIWCAEDQVKAMDEAKLNDNIVAASCDPNPVSEQYISGQRVGVRGTPTIIVDDGTIIGGYVPADNLVATLGLSTLEDIVGAPAAAE